MHFTDSLPRGDIVVVDGIRATSPARTLIDLGRIMPLGEFEDVLDRALVSRATPPAGDAGTGTPSTASLGMCGRPRPARRPQS